MTINHTHASVPLARVLITSSSRRIVLQTIIILATS